MLDGELIHLDLDTLKALQVQYLACLTAIATAHQNYTIAGRSFTRAQLPEVRKTLAEISFAIRSKTGGIRRTVYSDMSN